MRHLLIFLVLLFHIECLCQKINNKEIIIIADSITKQPIHFPHIYLEDSTTIFGNFNGEIIFEEVAKKSIIIHSIGYHEKVIKLTKLIDTIYLQPNVYNLPSITVTPILNNELLVGGYRKNLKQSTFKPILGSKVVYRISKLNNSGKLKELILPIKNPKKNVFIRILLLDVDDNGYPGKDIIDEDILFESTLIPKIISLEQYDLKVPKNGLFIGIEWLSNDKPNKFITAEAPNILTNWTLEQCNTYQQLPSKNKTWHILDYKNSKGKCLNIAVGLKIQY